VLDAMTARTSLRTCATALIRAGPLRRPRTSLAARFGPAALELTPPPDERAWHAHSWPGLLPARAHASSDAAAAVMLRGPRRSSVSDALRRRGPPSSQPHASFFTNHVRSKHACCALRGFGAIPHERRYQAS
jgi:hypothetical protein